MLTKVFYRPFCFYHRRQLSAPTRSERRDCCSAARPHLQDRPVHSEATSPPPQRTGPPHAIVQVHAILFASLTASLFSAFLAMLGKRWLNRYLVPPPSALRHICRHFLATLHSVLFRLWILTVASLSSNVRRSSSHLVAQSTASPPSASSFSCPSRLCRMSTISGEGYPSNWLVLVAGSNCCWYRLTRQYVAVCGHASGLSELSYNHVGLAMHVMIPLDKAVHL